MKLNASIIIAILLLLSGCGHLPDVPKVLRKPQVETTQEDAQTPNNNSKVLIEETARNSGTNSGTEVSRENIPSSQNTGTQNGTTIESPTSESPTSSSENLGSSAGTVATPNLEQQQRQPVASEQQYPAIIIEQDLFARMRKGFRLPDMESKYIRQQERWSTQHPTYMKDLFKRAEPFLYYIVDEVEKRGLPMELALLPAVESAFKSNAISRSSAAGLWQFIPSTGKHYGLRQDYWYDGRRDLIASTEAALTYLTELNAMFYGDWFLTLAAYNAGQGTVLKAIDKNKRANRPTDYQSLNLRLETERYVPKLLALKNLVQDPERYHVSLPLIPNKQNIATIDIPGQIDLKQFAQDSGIDYASLKNLNSAQKRWATSPRGPHRVIVPLRDRYRAQTVSQQLANSPSIKYRQHRIKRGESLSGIADQYGVTVSAIKTSNRLKNNNIRAGRDLVIPVRGLPERAVSQTNASGSSGSVATSFNTNTQESRKVIHRVKKGDTLWSIAKRYQVKLQELMSWNKLSSSQILSLNQQLLVFLK